MLKLSDEYRRLNEEQQKAVRAEGNIAVLAGPGSGKTATLVIKIAHLLLEKVVPPSGLACITYNNDAVREFRARLAELGIRARRGLFLGTVHSFCLNCIVRPYAALVDPRFKKGITVAGQNKAEEIFLEAAKRHVPESQARWLGATVTRYRRTRACGEDLSGFGDTDPLVVEEYENLLLQNGLVDFEGIILIALDLIRQQEWVRQLVAARFPWLAVDEYQDLGGPLHSIVTNLVDSAGVKVFAVGDADQTIYDFTGANPKYLNELASRADFESVRLKFNYRSGRRIIDASQAALAPSEPRGYVPHPERKDQGEIFFIQADGTHVSHAARVVEAVNNSRATGIAPEEIAIFYRAIGPLVEAIREELARQNIDFIWERDERFPVSPFIRWLQSGAAWALSEPQDREQTFSQLFREFCTLLQAAGKVERGADSLDFRILFHRLLMQPVDGRMLVHDWLARVEAGLGLRALLARTEEYSHDLESYDELTKNVSPEGTQRQAQLLDFASNGRVRGKVVLTTFHASKGRQFDVVIIPGCAEGTLPSWTWNGRQRRYEPPLARPLAEARRLFYVGLTRARHAIHLIHSDCWQDRFGNVRQEGISRFVEEIQVKLNTA
jgi:DNA helicase-2/ATP-dependent DNA helicase PcrA